MKQDDGLISPSSAPITGILSVASRRSGTTSGSEIQENNKNILKVTIIKIKDKFLYVYKSYFSF